MPWGDASQSSGIITGFMSQFLLKRFITLLATLIGASVVVFLVLEILPGNAAQILMGPDASPDAVAAWPPNWAWTGLPPSATGAGCAAC
jgi:hypothetical protein